jgi:hypothetical protein
MLKLQSGDTPYITCLQSLPLGLIRLPVSAPVRNGTLNFDTVVTSSSSEGKICTIWAASAVGLSVHWSLG